MRDLDAYQARYAALPFEPYQAYYRRQKVLEQLRRHRAKRILEVGCGLEPLFMHCADFDVMHVVEPCASFFAAAQAKAKNLPHVRMHAGTLEQSVEWLAHEPLDFIVLASLLHEVENPVQLLTQIRSLCQECTIVHAIVPNAKSLHRLLALAMGLIDSPYSLSANQSALQQQRTFDTQSLIGTMASSGFAVFEAGTFFVKPFAHAQMAELIERGFLTPQMLDGLYALEKTLPEFGSEIFVNARRAATR